MENLEMTQHKNDNENTKESLPIKPLKSGSTKRGRLSKTSKSSLTSIKEDVSTLRQSISSGSAHQNPYKLSVNGNSKRSLNNDSKSGRISLEENTKHQNANIEIPETTSVGNFKNEEGPHPHEKSTENVNARRSLNETIKNNENDSENNEDNFEDETMFQDSQNKISQTTSFEKMNNEEVSSINNNIEIANSRRSSNKTPPRIENANEKMRDSFEEKTSKTSSIEKSENEKVSSPTNKILETITEDEEVTDVDREDLEVGELNLKPVEDGKKAIFHQEVLSKKRDVQNGKMIKTEKGAGVQIQIAAPNRLNAVRSRQLSIIEDKKFRFPVKETGISNQAQRSYSVKSGYFQNFNIKGHSTYQLGPSTKWSTQDVQDILEILNENATMQMPNFNPRIASQLAKLLAAEIRKAVKEENYDRYRICVHVIIGENLMQGVHNNAQCLWDKKTDNFAMHFLKKSSYFVLSTCYGVYKE